MNMKILALNTAFSQSDVAVIDNDKCYLKTLDSEAKQSENILVCVDKLIKENKIDIKEIECIAGVVGPGSFTGIRIGVGIIKGMKIAKPNLKLISICSLDYLANVFKMEQKSENDFWCVLNALSGNYYICKYDKSATRLSEPLMASEKDIENVNGVVVGLDVEKLGICSNFVKFDARNLSEIVKQKFLAKDFVEDNEFLPLYLRKSQAEVELERKNGN